MYPLFAVDDQRSFDRRIHSHHFDSCICVARLFIFILGKHGRENPTGSSLLFVALSGKQKSQHYQINQRTTVLVSQMNQILAIVFISFRCVRKQFYTLFSFNPFVCNQKSLWQLFTMVSSGWSVQTNRDFAVDPFQVMQLNKSVRPQKTIQ